MDGSRCNTARGEQINLSCLSKYCLCSLVSLAVCAPLMQRERDDTKWKCQTVLFSSASHRWVIYHTDNVNGDLRWIAVLCIHHCSPSMCVCACILPRDWLMIAFLFYSVFALVWMSLHGKWCCFSLDALAQNLNGMRVCAGAYCNMQTLCFCFP